VRVAARVTLGSTLKFGTMDNPLTLNIGLATDLRRENVNVHCLHAPG